MKKILLFLYMLGCLLMYSLEGKSQVYNFGEDYYSFMFTQDIPSWTTIEPARNLDPLASIRYLPFQTMVEPADILYPFASIQYVFSPGILEYSYNYSLFRNSNSNWSDNPADDGSIGLGELEEILVPINDDVLIIILLLIVYSVFIAFRHKIYNVQP